jgi:hypothetical protein
MIISLEESGEVTYPDLFPAMHSDFILHKDLVGGSPGGWRFWYSLPLTNSHSTSKIARRIRHIIEPTRWEAEAFICVAVPWEKEKNYLQGVEYLEGGKILDWNGLLPVKVRGVQIRCRSVFSPTGWVSRGLSGLEIGRAWDIPAKLLPGCAELGPDWPFTREAPVKVVMWAGNRKWTASLQVREPIPVGGRNNENLVLGDGGEDPELPLAYQKAEKVDDVCVPVHLWDDKVWALTHDEIARREFETKFGRCPLEPMRQFLLRRWSRSLCVSLIRYLRKAFRLRWWKNPAGKADVEAGRECVWRSMEADWWSWPAGTRIYF